eukprot:scaffold166488_cov28-Tisochrysis_lutea.AAC.1
MRPMRLDSKRFSLDDCAGSQQSCSESSRLKPKNCTVYISTGRNANSLLDPGDRQQRKECRDPCSTSRVEPRRHPAFVALYIWRHESAK